MNSYEHTRLVGLRTFKRCATSKQILQVQPIYYSVNEGICDNYLIPLGKGML